MVDDENVVHTTKIEVGEELEHLFVVTDGIKVDDKILLEGLRKVRNNDEIHFEFADPDSVVTHLSLYAE